MSFTADSKGFYFNESPFTPLIPENVAIVTLCAHLSHDLKWNLEQAEAICKSGKLILWELDFDLSSYRFNPQDSSSFFSFSLAIEEFVKTVLPTFKELTFGVCFYRGNTDLAANFPLSQWESAFVEWLEEISSERGDHNYSVFCLKIFAEYLQRLISFLPDELLAFAIFDPAHENSMASLYQKLSRARFEYLNILLEKEGVILPTTQNAPLGICLPTDGLINESVLQKLNAIIEELQKKQMIFRVIPEARLTEEWNELDRLIVIPEAVSPQGKRKFLGFEAAGGVVLDSLNLL